MQVALNGKNIFYGIENWNQDNDFIWGPLTGNSWRAAPKNSDRGFYRVRTQFYSALDHSSSLSGVGAWADLGTMNIVSNSLLSPA
jgi:hypothetical protein